MKHNKLPKTLEERDSSRHIPLIRNRLENYERLLGGELSEEERKILEGRKRVEELLLKYHQEGYAF